MEDNSTVVIIGATGHFGTRISRRLVDEPNATLILTSRSFERAKALATELSLASPQASIEAAELDHTSQTLEQDLAALNPDIVVHTAGPFQDQSYAVARACIECGSHYVDLADGREFVEQFAMFDAAARARDVLLVSGASTLPGLSSAVIDAFGPQFREIHEIEISIAPAHQTPRGPGTVAAVLSYCGRPFKVWVDGHWGTAHGWQDMRAFHYPALGWRLAGACDVPDLALFPDYVPGCHTVTFHAALEAWWEQLALWCMAGLTRLSIVADWQPVADAFRSISARLTGLGSRSGGMHMRLAGVAADQSQQYRQVSWHLTAINNDGPEVPCSPALILTRKLIRHQIYQRGATPCLGLFTLAEFDEEVGTLDIAWEVSSRPAERSPNLATSTPGVPPANP